MKDVLLLTPPFTQLNTPYPATAYLKGFLNTKGIEAFQMDLGIEVILELFSEKGLKTIFDIADDNQSIESENAQRIYALKDKYIQSIDSVISFLQGKNLSFARQICSEGYLPQASRFTQLEELDYAFGNMGFQDNAKHLATLFLEDVSDFIVECVDENFGFSRYAERLGKSANSFDEIYDQLQTDPSHIDELATAILHKRLVEHQPIMVCMSVPFPGNLFSAFRGAQYIKEHFPKIKVCMGGGFPNTELRSLTEARVFEFFDFITLDDGELPIERLYKHIVNPLENPELKRTYCLSSVGEVKYINNCTAFDYKQNQVGTPDYSDLPLQNYISVIEIANPMHSLWSDGRWNKLTMAHGCYWGKCTFCDISLDYIKLYEPVAATLIVDRIEELIAQTGETGFHFVDEAAPPSLMKSVALEIIRRELTISWWTNIRFEKNFTKDLCLLLKASGCIAVSGGLEVASDRLLKLIDKGVTVEQVAQVTCNFTEANIMVHSYLMYGYPTQTIQETVDSLEMVRQLFEIGVLQSGFWHQFALTAHSPVGLNTQDYGIVPQKKAISFADNDIEFTDNTGIDHGKFSFGLKKSLFNFMHGIGFELPLQQWFEFKIPKTRIAPNFIEDSLGKEDEFFIKPSAKIVWLNALPTFSEYVKRKKGTEFKMLELNIQTNTSEVKVAMDAENGKWILSVLDKISVKNTKNLSFSEIKTDYESKYDAFEIFWYSKPMHTLRENGLLVL